MNSVLIIDDDKELCALMKKCVEQENLSAVVAHGGLEGLRLLEKNKDTCSLIILDVMMPDMNGFQVLQKIREKNNVPVLMLTAKSDEEDKVSGLRLGADDYLTKPFHLEELEARIRSLTRRRFTQNNVVLNCGKVAFDTKARVAVADGQELSLTRKEIGILEYLLLNQGRPVSQEELLDHVWDNSVDNFSNSIRVHISALRKKLRAALGYDPIRNRIGEGYVMEEEKV